MSKDVEKVEVTNEEQSGIGTYVFKKKTVIDGVEVKEVSYDLTQINGASIRRVKSNLTKKNYMVAVKEIDEVFQTAVFAECVGWTIENVEALAMVDYLAIADIVRDFIIGED